MKDLENQMMMASEAQKEKEKNRKAFFKRQQKFYCQMMWSQLANENKKPPS